MSSLADRANRFLTISGLDRGPWLVVAFATGIATWFALPHAWQWLALTGLALLTAIAAQARWRSRVGRETLALAVTGMAIAFALGVTVIWARSEMVGTPPIDAPRYGPVEGRILAREEQSGQGKLRLTLAMRDALSARAIKVRVNLDAGQDHPDLVEGAVVRLTARLMPPAPPLVPGAYDFARRAWFDGLAATGSAIGAVEVVSRAQAGDGFIPRIQRQLAQHVRNRMPGSAGTIAATLASGDRGAIAPADEDAMRDAGLTHLLSISGVHVSALMMVAYAAAFRLLALWPWLALRWRIPILAGFASAAAGVGYTLLTGAEVPTVRSCIGALLVLAALVLGREPLSLRVVAVAAAAVLFAWPEALVGASFQMSFAAVLAIVALHQSAPIRAFLAPREQTGAARLARNLAVLFVTGVVIELALMPIVAFHFHRAGTYGALANVIAIPLVSFVTMPLLALALLADAVAFGSAPVWWLTGQSIEGLLALAHWVARAPHAVRLVPEVSRDALVLFVGGGLWLALWRGRARLFGLAAIVPAAAAMAMASPPDLMITRDGRDMALIDATEPGGRLVLLRTGEPGSYTADTLSELAARPGAPLAITDWPGARCSRDFCTLALTRDSRRWIVLVARGKTPVEERALAVACRGSDIVIAGRWLPRSCMPRWLKADRSFLDREGGVSIDLRRGLVRTVADGQGDHGWWRPLPPRAFDAAKHEEGVRPAHTEPRRPAA